MKGLDFKKLFAEGFLIIFSVLFALFISGLSDDAKVKKQKKQALDKVRKELVDNQKVLKIWSTRHGKLLARIDSIISGQKPEVKRLMLAGDFVNFQPLMDGPLINELVSQTAWQAAQSTQIISEFSYENVEQLTLIYALQDIIVNQTVPKVVDAMLSRESQDLANIDATLNQLSLLMQEMVGQEYVQTDLYKQWLNY